MNTKQVSIRDCKQAFVVPGQNNIIDFAKPDGRSWHYNQNLDEMRQRYANVELVDFDEWHKDLVSRNNGTVTWTEVTEERYFEMLEVLPPVAFDGNNFMVGEAADHHGEGGTVRYSAYLARHKKFYASNRPMTVKEFKELLATNAPLNII